MKTQKPDLSQLTASLESCEKNLNKIKAGVCCETPTVDMNSLYSMMQDCYYALSDLKYTVSNLKYHAEYMNEWRDHHEHGHLPKVNGKEQMDKALVALGLEKEYQTAPKYIYASTRRGSVVQVG